ncbi:hypothetical protein L2E82_49357 [Cichorium intybus]|uniref:Uncharacterized protein n=1 Tax=Cichorium intybus TaxID=13427 RepID=A0ACB8YZH3_CICIN|nr:hypothetical protein L2E82_49357 [Cichorium intybus]
MAGNGEGCHDGTGRSCLCAKGIRISEGNLLTSSMERNKAICCISDFNVNEGGDLVSFYRKRQIAKGSYKSSVNGEGMFDCEVDPGDFACGAYEEINAKVFSNPILC